MSSETADTVRLHVQPCTQIIPFWHIDTPPGITAEIRVRAAAEVTGAFSDWVTVASWSSQGTGESTTLTAQQVHGLRTDADTVIVDTAALGGPARLVDLAVRAVPAARAAAAPVTVHWIDALTRTPARPRAEITASAPRGIDIEHRLPQISQHACGVLDGFAQADSWCSPTSLTMVMEWLSAGGAHAELDAHAVSPPAGEDAADRVHPTIRGVWDRTYGGAGNWAFNVAWANGQGFNARLDALYSMREAEELLAAGEVLIASVSFTSEQLPQAGYPTAGHLLIITGVTTAGDVRVHDPGRAIADGVRAVYPREAFERAWLSAEGSGGLVYRLARR